MAEDEWAEIAQDIPAKDEPFIKQYLFGQEALIAQEKKQRSGKYCLDTTHELNTDGHRPCIPRIPLPHGKGSLRDSRQNTRRGEAYDMDVRIRGPHCPRDWRKCIPWNDVLPGKGENGEDEAMADHSEDAQGSSVTCPYGRYGGF